MIAALDADDTLLIVVLLYVVSLILVILDYVELENRDPGGGKGLVGWIIGLVFLWIIFLPWYIVSRALRVRRIKRTPPRTTMRATLPPGWYSYAPTPGAERWWDGSQWTDHARPTVSPPLPPGQT